MSSESQDERERHLEVQMAEMGRDICYIKKAIDEDLKGSIGELTDKVAEIAPVVRDNAWWIGKLKVAIGLVVLAIVGGLLRLAWPWLNGV